MATISVSSGYDCIIDRHGYSYVDNTSWGYKSGDYGGLGAAMRIPFTTSSSSFDTVSFTATGVSLEQSGTASVVWTISTSDTYSTARQGNLGNVSLSSSVLSGSSTKYSLSANTQYYLWIFSSNNTGTASNMYVFTSPTFTMTVSNSAGVVSAPNMTIGTASTITISGYTSSYTYKLYYSTDGDLSYTSITSSAGSASYSWTPSKSTFLDKLGANSTSMSCVIKCDTYSGSTLNGSSKCTITLTGATSDLQPTVSMSYSPTSGITIDTSSSTSTTVTVSITPTALHNATIKSGSFVYYVGGTKTTKSFTSYTSFSFKPSSNSYSYTVTDSRGLTTSSSGSFGGSSYSSPTITVTASAPELDSDGETASTTITASGTFYNSNGNSISSVKYRYKTSSGSYSSSYSLSKITTNGNNFTATSSTTPTITGLSYSESYVVECTVTDTTGNSAKSEYTIATKPVFYWSGTDFYFNADVHFNGESEFNNEMSVASGVSTPMPSAINDYITEHGSTTVSGVTWYYRKWNSGMADCWATYSTTGLNCSSNTMNGFSYSNEVGLTFPFTFYTSPVLNATVFGGSCVLFASLTALNTTKAGIRFVCNNTTSTSISCSAVICVHGIYKKLDS